MFRNLVGEKIEKNRKSHFCDNLVPARPENFWSRIVNNIIWRKSSQKNLNHFYLNQNLYSILERGHSVSHLLKSEVGCSKFRFIIFQIARQRSNTFDFSCVIFCLIRKQSIVISRMLLFCRNSFIQFTVKVS